MKFKCLRCGYGEKEGEWEARTKKPKACPRCKSYQWNVPKKEGKIKQEDGKMKTKDHICQPWTKGEGDVNFCCICGKLLKTK